MNLLLIGLLVISGCTHTETKNSRIIVSKRSVNSAYLLPKIQLDRLPTNSHPLWKSVYINLAQKNYHKIEMDMRRFLRQNPGHIEALTVLAKVLFLQKKYKLATYYSKLVISLDNDNDDAQMVANLVVMVSPDSYQYQKQAAQLRLASLFDNSKTHVASGLNLGIWLLKKGNCQQAMQYFSQVAKRCSSCGMARVAFAICLLRSGKFNRGHRLLLSVNDTTDDALARYYLAFSYFKIRQDIAKARKILKRILDDTSQDGHIRNKARSLLILIQNQGVSRRVAHTS